MSKAAQYQGVQSILLDTHIAVWLAEGNSRLKSATLKIVEDHFFRRTLFISPISAWEIGMLSSRNRLSIGQAPQTWFAEFLNKFSVNTIEISPEIAISSSYLPGVFHGDPADRILVSTAIAHTMTVLTADREILSYGKQGFVSTLPV